MSYQFSSTAPRLIDNGWPAVIPDYGKVPAVSCWPAYNQIPVPAPVLAYWCRRYPDANVGLPLGHRIVAVDIDIVEGVPMETVAEIADATIGWTDFLRVGRPPRQLRLYRGHVMSRKHPPIEIFGNSGQVVIYGMHPTTGHPYFWPFDEPFYRGPGDLPAVNEESVDLFLTEALTYLKTTACIGGIAEPHQASNRDIFLRLRLERRGRRGVDYLAIIMRQLAEAREGTLHDTMLSVVGALVRSGWSDPEIHDLFEAHFAAPRSGIYSPVWQQIGPAILGARRKCGIAESIDDLTALLGVGGAS
jgi:hypothetical protein